MNPKALQAILRSIWKTGKKVSKYNRRNYMPKDGNVRLPWRGNPVRSLGGALSRDKMGRREFLQRSKKITDETRDLTKLSINSKKLQERQDRANIFLRGNRKKASLIDQAEIKRHKYIGTEYLKHELKLKKRLQTDSKFYEKTKKANMDEMVGEYIDAASTKESIREDYDILGAYPKDQMIGEILGRARKMVTGNSRWWHSSPFNLLTGINKFSTRKNNISGGSLGKVIKKSRAKMNTALESAGVNISFRKKLDKELKISKLGGLRGGGRPGTKLERAQAKLKDRLIKNYGKGRVKQGYHTFIDSIAPNPDVSVKDLGVQEAFDNRPGGILKYIDRLTKEQAKENPLLQAFREGLYGK